MRIAKTLGNTHPLSEKPTKPEVSDFTILFAPESLASFQENFRGQILTTFEVPPEKTQEIRRLASAAIEEQCAFSAMLLLLRLGEIADQTQCFFEGNSN